MCLRRIDSVRASSARRPSTMMFSASGRAPGDAVACDLCTMKRAVSLA